MLKVIKKYRAEILLFGIVVLQFWVSLRYFRTYNFFKDNYMYATSALGVARGILDFSKIYWAQYRFIMYFPIALFYKIFGISNLTTALWPITASIGDTIVVYLISVHIFNRTLGVIAAFLMCICPLIIREVVW